METSVDGFMYLVYFAPLVGSLNSSRACEDSCFVTKRYLLRASWMLAGVRPMISAMALSVLPDLCNFLRVCTSPAVHFLCCLFIV